MSTQSTDGYLVISDISGFTAYVAQTELEHSQEVLAELLELLVACFQPLLTLVKLEGDAVFVHAPARRVTRGESLFEVIEATYVAFRRRVDGIVRRTTCECNACRAIPMLDLKFIAHYGSYVIQHVSGTNDLVGSDVNLVHRLTKNHVAETTGWRAYVLFTDACLQQMSVPPEGMHRQVERYEHLGEVTTFSVDLRSRYREIIESQRVFITADEADVTSSHPIAAPQVVVWDWLTDPAKRTRYWQGTRWSAASRPGGRTGVGASNHCAHGKGEVSVENILDWRPFDHYTSEFISKIDEETPLDYFVTFHLEPGNEGAKTHVHINVKLKKRTLAGLALHKLMAWQIRKPFRIMEALIREEMTKDSGLLESVGILASAGNV